MKFLALFILISVCSLAKTKSIIRPLKYKATSEQNQIQEEAPSNFYQTETTSSNKYEQPPAYHPNYKDTYQEAQDSRVATSNYDSNEYQTPSYKSKSDLRMKFKPSDSPPLYPISLFEKKTPHTSSQNDLTINQKEYNQNTNYHSNEPIKPRMDQEQNYQPKESHKPFYENSDSYSARGSLEPNPSQINPSYKSTQIINESPDNQKTHNSYEIVDTPKVWLLFFYFSILFSN